MKKNIVVLILLVSSCFAHAQQLAQFTSYQLSPFNYNPAYAGVDGKTQFNTLIRQQWQGINDAPQSTVLNGYGLLKNEKMGLGATAFKDVAGADNRSGFSLSYSYHLRLQEKLNLSLGLSLGLLQYKLDHTIVNPYDVDDPLFNAPIFADLVPTASFGAYLYTEKYYVSIALPQLLTSSFTLNENYQDAPLISEGLTSHYFIGGGYYYDISSDFTLEPSVLVMMAPPLPVSVDIFTKVKYKDFLWSAIGYRLDDALSFYVGYDLNDQFFIAYGHDFITSGLADATSGSNEFKLGFRFNKAK